MALPMDVLTHINNRLMSIYHTLDHFSHLKVYYLLERLEYFSGKASHFFYHSFRYHFGTKRKS